jgi:hypothetical protein
MYVCMYVYIACMHAYMYTWSYISVALWILKLYVWICICTSACTHTKTQSNALIHIDTACYGSLDRGYSYFNILTYIHIRLHACKCNPLTHNGIHTRAGTNYFLPYMLVRVHMHIHDTQTSILDHVHVCYINMHILHTACTHPVGCWDKDRHPAQESRIGRLYYMNMYVLHARASSSHLVAFSVGGDIEMELNSPNISSR